MAALTVAAVSLPLAAKNIGSVPANSSSPGSNGGVIAFGNGSTGADTVAGADLVAVLPRGPLKELFATTFTDIGGGDTAAVQAQKAFAILGGQLAVAGFGLASAASAIGLTCASGSAPNLTVTTTGASGFIKVASVNSINY